MSLTPSYSSTAGINLWLAGVINGFVVPDVSAGWTAEKTNSFIVGYETQLNRFLSNVGYTMPITDEATIAWINIYLEPEIAYRLWISKNFSEEIPETVREWHRQYREWMAELSEDKSSGNFLKHGVIAFVNNYLEDD